MGNYSTVNVELRVNTNKAVMEMGKWSSCLALSIVKMLTERETNVYVNIWSQK